MNYWDFFKKNAELKEMENKWEQCIEFIQNLTNISLTIVKEHKILIEQNEKLIKKIDILEKEIKELKGNIL